jgi:hypothetical protein
VRERAPVRGVRFMFWYGQDGLVGQHDGGRGSRRDAVLVIRRYANWLHTERKKECLASVAFKLPQYSKCQMYVQDSQGCAAVQFWTVLMMYTVSIFRTEHNVSEAQSVSILRWKGGEAPTQCGQLQPYLFT